MRFFIPALALASLAAAADSGWTGTIKNTNGLSGNVMVVNETTIMITDYTLEDASAPSLHWWGATNSQLDKGFRVHNARVTETAKSSTLMVSLDAGHMASDFEYFGLWCETLAKNFGQAQLSKATSTMSGSSSSASAASASASPSSDKKAAAAGLSSPQGVIAAIAVAAAAFMV